MFDKDAYRRLVLDPARAQGNAPPADLLVRYALDGKQRMGGDEFNAHVDAVVAEWRKIKQQKRVYAKLVDALLTAHGDLQKAGLLTWDKLERESRERARAAAGRLTETVSTLAGTTTLVSRAAFEHLVTDTGGACTEAEVRKALSDQGVRVAERTWELPESAPPMYRPLREAVGRLGLRLSAEVVVGADAVRRGFRLRDGFALVTASEAGPAGPLTGGLIEAAVRRSAGRARDEGKAATDSVLATLREAAREPGRLDALLLWEVMEVLRPQADAGFPLRTIAERAAGLGLVRAEADELALAMLARDVRPAGAAGEIQDALQDGRLRAAERLLPGLPADAPPELRAEVEEKARQVAQWSERAVKERAAGRTEAAAELLDRACRVAADDDALAERLRALPPPPPSDVRVAVQDGRVSVAWTPGAARVGPVRHRVVRTVGAPAGGAAAGTAVGETESNELTDPAPPVAEELHYSVFATRADGIWSAPAAGGPVTSLPEASDVSVEAGEREVAVTWRLPAGATGAEVTRQDERAARGSSGGRSDGRSSGGSSSGSRDRPDGRVIRADRGGFVDSDVTRGRTYRYRVRVVYESSDGTRLHSRGVVVTARPEGRAEPVRDLRVELAGGDGPPTAKITWTPPSVGRVVIRTSGRKPPWPRGMHVPQADVERYGREVPGTAVRGSGGRMALTTRVDGARRHFVAVSLGAGDAVVGPSATLALVEPVRELTADRRGDRVALSWLWPDDAQLARVVWAPDAADPGADPDEWGGTAVDCSRHTYQDDGCRLDVGPGAVRIAVRTIVRDGGDELRSRPVVTVVPGAGAKVRYEFRRPRTLRRRAPAAVLALTADHPCRLPDLVVVHRAGGLLPLSPEQGRVVAEVPARDLEPGEPHTVRFKVPPGAGRLACFATAGGAGAVQLIRIHGAW